ncbi:GNAT family N-acetyltransferase [Massilia sp. PAMC28688]|uniref:GNAT family N-acetyltransferase n=1 Tax=Massilia sp. PAMC28688 TaxID=2861283 RepID=UPI001C627C70|nr:GNAT family N-acetyltransferase [Massilia sp. PAMC28688]QYF92301.1 GNAT family N-acetyltransferase [Massilia sp. PAMC28688]
MAFEIQLRPCVAGDAEALALIGSATFVETYADVLPGPHIIAHCRKAHSQAQYSAWLADPAYQIWLAELQPNGSPVGFMVVGPPDLPMETTDADLEIKRIYLLSKFQGKGSGRRMVEAAAAHGASRKAARLLLGVYTRNHPAIAFYQRTSFGIVGSRTFNVGGHDYDDHIMGRLL